MPQAQLPPQPIAYLQSTIPTTQMTTLLINSKILLKRFSRKVEATCGQFGYWTIQSNTTHRSFVSCGSTLERLRFARLFLQTNNPQRRFSLNLSRSLPKRLLAENELHGLTVLAKKPCPSLEHYTFKIPKFVPMHIAVPNDLNEFIEQLPQDRRQLLKRLHKSQLRAVFSSSLDFIPEFYKSFLLPSMHLAHGNESVILSPSKVKHEIVEQHAEFLQIFNDNQCIAAGLCKRSGSTFKLMQSGWLNGSNSILKDGVQAFRIWTALQHAKQLGCHTLDLGGSPPFLSDGVLNYKMRWNASISDSFEQFGSHFLLIDPQHTDVQSFFHRHPTLIIDHEGKLGLCSTSPPDSIKLKHTFSNSIARFWRLASPIEALEKQLSIEPTPQIASGWFVNESRG
jgi:hypothetical protein